MTNFQSQFQSAAKAVGEYLIESEFDTLKDEFPHTYCCLIREEGNTPAGECFREFVNWVTSYMYYYALVCICKDEKELEDQLRSDYDELYNECQ